MSTEMYRLRILEKNRNSIRHLKIFLPTIIKVAKELVEGKRRREKMRHSSLKNSCRELDQ
jgi:hypothetical protein